MVCRGTNKCASRLVWPCCTCTRFSHQKREPDDCDAILWCHCHYTYVEGWEYIRGSTHELEADHLGLFGRCTSKLPLEKPLTLCHSYFGAPQGVRVQLTGKCSSFVQLHVPKAILGTLSWYQFSCLQVNWVVHHLISHGPCIGVAWTTTFWSELVHAG